MYANHPIRRAALARIHHSIRAGTFGYGWTEGGEGGAGGGGAPEPKPDPKPAEKAETLTLTQAELDAKVSAALAEQQRKADAKAKKEQDERDAEEAKKRGEFETLAKKEKERADAAESENKSLKRSAALSAHLAEKHPDYAGCAKYIAPLLPVDLEGDALDKAIASAAADYVKDNPREKGGGPPPPLPRTGNRSSAAGAGDQPRKDRNALPNGNRISMPASRF